MTDHRAADPAASRRLGGVHGLQLCVAPAKLLQRPDTEELTIAAEAEERDGRVEETVDVKCMDVFGRAVRIGEREVALQQFADVLGPRVVNQDLPLRHGRSIHAWIRRKGGLVYVSRDDPAIMVGNRFGVGFTFNFGNPAAWLVCGTIAAVPAGLAIIGAAAGM